MIRARLSRLLRSFRRHRFLVFVALLALAVRLVWNLWIHPPEDYVFSDMGGYVARADRMLDAPLGRRGDEAFWPYGTHYLLAAVKAVFGRQNHAATAAYQAVLGAAVAALVYATSRRIARGPWTPRVTGVLAALYYPHVSFGGYYLSETPFSLCLAAAAFLTLRLADRGRPRDAWLLGLVFGVGATIRPQILMGIPFLGLFWLLRRRALRRIRPGLLARAAVPLALVLGLSSARAYYHTNQVHLVSTNGAVNRVFARCHNFRIENHRGNWFSPPALGALKRFGERFPWSPLKLDPVREATLKFKGSLSDERVLDAIAKECVRESGWLRQARFGLTHLVLLWAFNIPWPDSSRDGWRVVMALWSVGHTVFLLPPLLVALALALRRRAARHGLLAMHVFGLLAVAVLYFGDTRYRVPYDAVILVLALDVHGRAAPRLLGRVMGMTR